MKKLLVFTMLVIFLATPTPVNSQTFTCSWNASAIPPCGIGSESCNEAGGEFADAALCSPILTQTGCNASGYNCSTSGGGEPPSLTNRYTCEWDSAANGGAGECVPQVTDNCSDGFEPGNSCTGVPPGNCNSSQRFVCVGENNAEPGEPGGACLQGVSPPCSGGAQCIGGRCVAQNAGNGGTGDGSTTEEKVRCLGQPGTVNTAIGCIPLGDVNSMARFFIGWALGVAGGIALLMIGLASFRIATSQGNPQRLQGGQELLMSAIGGLLMVVLSIYLLRFIGVDLLGLF